MPVQIAISIANGGGDAQGSERGLEYDTMSGKYAEWVEHVVLPLVESKCNVQTHARPQRPRGNRADRRGGAVSLIMAWYHPELYHRVLAYSGTWINQQWPWNPATPHGAWGFVDDLIPNSPRKPIRIWMEVGDRDLYNPNAMRDGMHDWVVANEKMAARAGGEALPLPICVRAQRGPRGPRDQTANPAGGTGIPLAGLPKEVTLDQPHQTTVVTESGGSVSAIVWSPSRHCIRCSPP